jgi:8-oxo-dGTP pyrophosphatase MutT (NUDIX family)
VAIVVAEAVAGPELLFIERAARLGDPWSGQMAFPGGRVEPSDAHARAAAERETIEEVGVDLAAAECLGRLDDVQAGLPVVAPFVLSAFVYRLAGPVPLMPNHEVREGLWVPVQTVVDPARAIRHRFGLRRFPAIVVGDPDRHVVWGLTYGLLADLFERTGVPLARGT